MERFYGRYRADKRIPRIFSQMSDPDHHIFDILQLSDPKGSGMRALKNESTMKPFLNAAMGSDEGARGPMPHCMTHVQMHLTKNSKVFFNDPQNPLMCINAILGADRKKKVLYDLYGRDTVHQNPDDHGGDTLPLPDLPRGQLNHQTDSQFSHCMSYQFVSSQTGKVWGPSVMDWACCQCNQASGSYDHGNFGPTNSSTNYFREYFEGNGLTLAELGRSARVTNDYSVITFALHCIGRVVFKELMMDSKQDSGSSSSSSSNRRRSKKARHKK